MLHESCIPRFELQMSPSPVELNTKATPARKLNLEHHCIIASLHHTRAKMSFVPVYSVWSSDPADVEKFTLDLA